MAKDKEVKNIIKKLVTNIKQGASTLLDTNEEMRDDHVKENIALGSKSSKANLTPERKPTIKGNVPFFADGKWWDSESAYIKRKSIKSGKDASQKLGKYGDWTDTSRDMEDRIYSLWEFENRKPVPDPETGELKGKTRTIMSDHEKESYTKKINRIDSGQIQGY